MKKYTNSIKRFILAALLTTAVSANAAYYNSYPAGAITGASVNFNNGTSVKLSPGYGDINGNYWEITASDAVVTTGYTLSGLSATTYGVFHYIYIDYANSSLPSVTLRNSTTAPTRDDDKLGWYDGNDRCIGVVWVNAAGGISAFRTIDPTTILCAPAQIVSNGAVTTTYPGSLSAMSLTSVSNYLPVNVTGARMEISCDMGSNVQVDLQLFADDGTYLSKLPTVGYRKAITAGWVDIAKTASRNFRWFGYSTTSANVVNIWIFGYKFDR